MLTMSDFSTKDRIMAIDMFADIYKEMLIYNFAEVSSYVGKTNNYQIYTLKSAVMFDQNTTVTD
jgi:hypothetical protein